jgi:hypothetical protein
MRSAVCGGSLMSGMGGSGHEGIAPKYCCTQRLAWELSKSPAITSTALLGV